MPKFLFTAQYTQSGLEGTVKEGFANREATVRGLMQSAGLSVEALYWAYGSDDLVGILDGPAEAVVGFSMAVTIGGGVRISTTPLLTAAEMDAAVAAMPADSRPPGG